MTLVRIELGRTNPKISTMEKMSRALGMELMLVARELRFALEAFSQSGGSFLGRLSWNPGDLLPTATKTAGESFVNG